MLDPRWCDPAPPEAIEDALRGRAIERRRPARQVPDPLARGRRPPRHAPAHDRQPAARRATPRTRPHLRVEIELDDGRSACCSSTCAASAPATCCSAATRSPSTSPRGSASSRSSPDFTAEALRALARGRKQPVKAFLLNQERDRGRGQHLRRRGAVSRADPPAAPGRHAEAPQLEALRDAVVESLELGHRLQGRVDRRLPPRRRRRAAASRTASSSTRARASPASRCGTPIQKLRAAGRGTYVCPSCQPRPRVRQAAARS